MPLDKKSTYLPNKNVWLNKLYFQISNSQERKCLTIDTRDVNKFEPGKCRTNANDGEEQMCYFNKNKGDTHFSSFLSQRCQAEPINFSIVKQIFDIEFINKSLETNAKNSVFAGELKSQLQQNSSKSFRDGRSETKKQQNRLYITNVTDSTDVREQQRDRHKNQRRKPRFLSAS